MGEIATSFSPAIARALRTVSAWASRFSITSVSVNAWTWGVIE